MGKLFLLKADFQDDNRADGKSYFCADCAIIEGLLSYYPILRDELDIHYIDFVSPRKILVDLLGEANQSCPVLILENGTFINSLDELIKYLTENYKIGERH